MPTSDNYASYPPSYRPSPGAAGPGPDAVSCTSAAAGLPVVDLKGLDQERLVEACEDWGIFRLVNHGIPRELLSEVLELANEFFSRGFEWKQALKRKAMFYFWGSPSLSQSGTSKQTGPFVESQNWLEGLNFPLSESSSSLEYDLPLLQRFRSLLIEYGAHQTRLAQTLFNAMANHLAIPLAKSSSYLSPPTAFLRVYRYLRCPGADRRLGIMEHTDSSVLTILHQDHVGGLQVYRDHMWLDIDPVPDTLIVNLGDMMQVPKHKASCSG
ncbi:gibberellin 2-beta-dioxygenase 6 isoform X2 [Andrographis paniculata]|uniref:gibberellin 2-beta-dioxygenase 6 isoform X2 n=1 Tax=Andrographis paniculata TaxID=175694 RepID=UPI0021E94F57|nr:gibberellin 2-beta-dioxygenase 6 isoform X2 [Andrographis paniculata]